MVFMLNMNPIWEERSRDIYYIYCILGEYLRLKPEWGIVVMCLLDGCVFVGLVGTDTPRKRSLRSFYFSTEALRSGQKSWGIWLTSETVSCMLSFIRNFSFFSFSEKRGDHCIAFLLFHLFSMTHPAQISLSWNISGVDRFRGLGT